MYNYDVDVPKEELSNAIVQELRLLGLRHASIPKRANKSRQNPKATHSHGSIFRKPLHLLSSRIVHLQSGVDAEVPNVIQEICCCVVQHAETDGLFRKAGSAARQRELKALLDQGHEVQFSQHHVIDVANILKYFLRELPDPVLPCAYHDLFLHCLLLKDIDAAVLLACLLLPRPHLHVLAYLMEFFHLVAGFSDSNKMTASNLAIVIAPTLMPVSAKVPVVHNAQRISAHVRVVEIMINNAERIGVLPDGVVGKLSLASSVSTLSLLSDDQASGLTFSLKKKRRRSGSLTRMFNGLRKIVAGKPSPGTETEFSGLEDETALVPSTKDFSTPCVKSAKKRKVTDNTSAFSSKKKKDVLMGLPQSVTLADTPFKKTQSSILNLDETPQVCGNPNPIHALKSTSDSPPKNKSRKFFPSKTCSEFDNQKSSSNNKKGLSGVSNFVMKKQKPRSERHSTSGNFLERSWSAVSSSHWGRKKLRQSDQTRFSVASTSSNYAPAESDSSHDADIGIDLSQEGDPFDPSSSDFVQVPKSEYEDLKCRMSAIETCISKEFSSVSTAESTASPEKIKAANTHLAVQTVYEKTLEDADIGQDASTDQLAKRLSRELKIRRSGECKVIRSPSARKIGSLRRRSRERQSPTLRRELRRNKSWHMMQRPVNVSLCSGTSTAEVQSAHISRLKRGRPNTVFSGLPHPTPNRSNKEVRSSETITILGADSSPVTRSQTRRASSFHGSEPSSPAILASKKCKSQVNLAKAALLAHAQQRSNRCLELDEKWQDAYELLNSSKDLLTGAPTTGRESVAKLRSANAGKVMATAKLFNANSADSSKPMDARLSKSNDSRGSPASQPVDSTPNKDFNQSKSRSVGETTLSPPPMRRQSIQCNVTSLKTTDNLNSPAAYLCTRKLRGKVSPTLSPTMRNASSKIKKHSSMKVGRVAHSQPVKRNLSAPVQWIDSGKENQVDKCVPKASQASRGSSPQSVKNSVPLTERIQRVSASPLKDCNRISSQSRNVHAGKLPTAIPCTTPNIKQPLTSLTPRRKAFTPQANRAGVVKTPLKVTATPLHTPVQRSSRLPNNAKASVKIVRPCK